MSDVLQKYTILKRLWQYQKERFPLFKHGILIASFSFCAVCLSSLLRGSPMWPGLQVSCTAFICLLLFFLQLRIADEYKDHEEDVKFRPERPVPRGLVTLGELKVLGIIAAVIQSILTYLLNPVLLLLLVLVWSYMAAMRAEFFIAKWLKKHPFAYLCTHMVIMPLIDLFATACDWLQAEGRPPYGLIWFLSVSFFNGVIIEIGRKTWAPEQERPGVESYSANWGIKPSIAVWLVAIAISVMCASVVAVIIPFFFPVLVTLLIVAALLFVLGIAFIKNPTPQKSKRIENASGLWVVVLYFILGIIPMGVNTWINKTTLSPQMWLQTVIVWEGRLLH